MSLCVASLNKHTTLCHRPMFLSLSCYSPAFSVRKGSSFHSSNGVQCRRVFKVRNALPVSIRNALPVSVINVPTLHTVKPHLSWFIWSSISIGCCVIHCNFTIFIVLCLYFSFFTFVSCFCSALRKAHYKWNALSLLLCSVLLLSEHQDWTDNAMILSLIILAFSGHFGFIFCNCDFISFAIFL